MPEPQEDMSMQPEGGEIENGNNMPQQGPNTDQDMNMNAMEPEMSDNNGDDSTMSIINQLSDTDREAVRAYAESMLNRDETQDTPMDNMEEPVTPMQEGKSVIFTKKQLREMNENFGPTADELEKTKPEVFSKKTETNNNNTPFNKPKFN